MHSIQSHKNVREEKERREEERRKAKKAKEKSTNYDRQLLVLPEFHKNKHSLDKKAEAMGGGEENQTRTTCNLHQ